MNGEHAWRELYSSLFDIKWVGYNNEQVVTWLDIMEWIVGFFPDLIPRHQRDECTLSVALHCNAFPNPAWASCHLRF